MLHGLRDPALLQRILYEALDHSDDIIVILEQTGDGADDIVIAAVNEAFCHTCGRSQQELIGRTLRSLVAPMPTRRLATMSSRRYASTRSYRSEMLCARQGGATFWLGLHLMPVRDGNPLRGIILGHDITESLQAREQQAAIQGLLAKVFLCVKAPVAIVTDSGTVQMTNPARDRAGGFRLRPAGTRGCRRAGDLRDRRRRVAAHHGERGLRGVSRSASGGTLCRCLPGARQPGRSSGWAS
jgi:PAS domain S-box-containing protein